MKKDDKFWESITAKDLLDENIQYIPCCIIYKYYPQLKEIIDDRTVKYGDYDYEINDKDNIDPKFTWSRTPERHNFWADSSLRHILEHFDLMYNPILEFENIMTKLDKLIK